MVADLGQIYHYRDRDQYEVDGVLEDNAGRVVGVEVKAAKTVRDDDFRGLKLLQRRVGAQFRAGFVLYCGTSSSASAIHSPGPRRSQT